MKRLFLLVLAGCTMYAAPHSYGHQKTPQESLGDYARKQRAQTQAQQGVLKNDDVLRMTKAGLPDATIVSLIQQNGGTFDTSPDALIALKKGGVSSGVIDAMVAARVKAPNRANIFQNNSPAFSGRSTPTGDGGVPLPAEMGVYLLAGDKLNELEPEIVGWQTGGNIKRGVTLGWTHGHINGKVMHPHSPYRLETPVDFIIKTAEGTSATEYQLLRLDEKGNRREFRAITGGVFHASGGTEKNGEDFTPIKIAPRVYRIHITDLKTGEYGFLAPVFSSGLGASGKMYTFRLE
jgi:hypothetical protein